MLSHSDVIEYNKNAIAEWELEIEIIPINIAKEQKRLRQLDDEMQEILTQARTLHEEINTRHQLFNDNQSAKYTKEARSLQHDIDQLIQYEQSYLVKQKEKEEQTAKARAAIFNLNQRKLLLTQQITDANGFLRELEKEPQELFTKTFATIQSAFNDFDKRCYDQDDNIRLCFYQLQQQLNIIAASKEKKIKECQRNVAFPELNAIYQSARTIPGEINLENENREWQLRFAQLCGFIWYLRERYEYLNTDPNTEFVELLISLLQKMHIAKEGYLPVRLGLPFSVRDEFTKLRTDYFDVFSLTQVALQKLRKQDYQNALHQLQEYGKSGNGIHHLAANELAQAIEREVAATPSPVYQPYTRALNQAYGLFQNYEKNTWDEALYDRYIKNANQINGHPSTSKKVAGALLGVVGVLLVIGGATSIVLTAGTTAVPATCVAVLGGMIIAKALALSGLALSMSIGGWTLFHFGTRRGVSKKMINTSEVFSHQHDLAGPKIANRK